MTIDRTEAHRQLNKLCSDFHVTGRRQGQYTSSLLGRVTSAWQGLLHTLHCHSHILGLLQWPRIVMLIIIIALANTVTYTIIFTILFPFDSRNQVANPPPTPLCCDHPPNGHHHPYRSAHSSWWCRGAVVVVAAGCCCVCLITKSWLCDLLYTATD